MREAMYREGVTGGCDVLCHLLNGRWVSGQHFLLRGRGIASEFRSLVLSISTAEGVWCEHLGAHSDELNMGWSLLMVLKAGYWGSGVIKSADICIVLGGDRTNCLGFSWHNLLVSFSFCAGFLYEVWHGVAPVFGKEILGKLFNNWELRWND